MAMLILIPGISGNLGHHLARAALARGFGVRGLGRSPEKLDADIRAKLESFHLVEDATRHDYDPACQGVDAIIIAWAPTAKLVVDAQLPLLRAAERANIRRFHAASWNFDWENMALGEIDTYDSMILFANHARLTSTIRPTYAFVGVLANTLFGVPGAGALEGDNAIWRRGEDGKRTIRMIGDGNARLNYTSEEDAADFAVAFITGGGGEAGGCYRFCSDTFTLRELATVYQRARGAEASTMQVLGVDDCERIWRTKRAGSIQEGLFQQRIREWVPLQYGWYMALGTSVSAFDPVDTLRCPDVKRTAIEDYIKNNDYV